jgi:hypothetical protein
VAVPMPTPATRWRCSQCGNLPRVEETELLAHAVEQVSCRWCAGTDTVEIVERVDAGTGPDTGSTAAGRSGSSDTA